MHSSFHRRTRRTLATIAFAALLAGIPALPSSALGGNDAGRAIVDAPDGNGYAIISATGGQYNYGSSRFSGSLAGTHLNAPIVAAVAIPGAGDAKWYVAADGGVFTEGSGGQFFGSMAGRPLNAPMTAILASPTGKGYLLVAADGGTFAFGDYPFPGSLGGLRLNAPVVDAARDSDPRHVWLVASDGGVFALGTTPFFGSMGGRPLNAPMTAILASPTGKGYLLAARDGGTFAFGDFPFPGSLAGLRLNAPVVDAALAGHGTGVWLLGEDGGIFALSAPFYGNALSEANPPHPTYPAPVPGNGGLVNVSCPAGGAITVAAQIAANLKDLLTAAKTAGYSLCGSGWRSAQRQIELRKQNCGSSYEAIWVWPSSRCNPATAIPGTSMHEKGLAVDFTSATTAGFNWLKANAPGFGLYLLISGTEPWHFSTNGR
ncbi:M15 family metallopeptidase [Streptosporangiaceae bacterium NEAU-GS5]|nr:M15 family metallopeptidase [Streptosporangiaceae bacterium NEAU-GS5]